ncbi:MAG: hypothetical protein AAB316_09605, partial [Bacteroidota bacterium]
MFNPFKLPFAHAHSSYRKDEVSNDADAGLLFNFFKRNKRLSEAGKDEITEHVQDEMRQMRKDLKHADENDRYEIM